MTVGAHAGNPKNAVNVTVEVFRISQWNYETNSKLSDTDYYYYLKEGATREKKSLFASVSALTRSGEKVVSESAKELTFVDNIVDGKAVWKTEKIGVGFVVQPSINASETEIDLPYQFWFTENLVRSMTLVDGNRDAFTKPVLYKLNVTNVMTLAPNRVKKIFVQNREEGDGNAPFLVGFLKTSIVSP
jgi:hypothetical protein